MLISVTKMHTYARTIQRHKRFATKLKMSRYWRLLSAADNMFSLSADLKKNDIALTGFFFNLMANIYIHPEYKIAINLGQPLKHS